MSDIRTRFMIQDDASSKLQKIASAGRQTESALKQAGQAVDNAFRANSINAFRSAAESAINQVSASFQELGVDIDEVMNEFAEGFEEGFADAFEESFKEAAEAAKDVGDAAKEAGRGMDTAADDAKDFGDKVKDIGDGADDIKKTGDAAKDAGEAMGSAGDKAITFSDAIKKIVTAAAGLKALKEIKDFTMDSINLGMEYTASMSEVAAISGASAEELQQLEATAREYGATTVFSAKESADALKYMSLAGWNAEQSASALGGVLDLAASSGMGLGEASDMVTDYLSAFGMEANQATYFADMLSYAQSNSNTSARQLGEAFLNSAANLHSAGQDIETTTSMLEAMANQGTKGSRAGTQLAAIMRDITNGMEDGAIKIGETSVAVADETGAFRDLTDIMKDVEIAVGGMESAQRAAALSETFTADSTKGLNQILTEGVDNIADYEEALRGSAGAASLAADTMNDNLSGDLKAMNSAWEEMKIQVFEALEDPLREGVQYITSTIIPAITTWVPKVFESVASELSKIGNAIKPLFETVLKNPKGIMQAFASVGTGLAVFKGIGFAQNIFNAATGVGELTTNMSGLSGMFVSLASTIVSHPIAAGIAGVVAALVALDSVIEEHNKKEIQMNLDQHFGDVSLDKSQVSALADEIVPVDIVAELHAASVKFEEAEELREKAEEKLDEVTSATWHLTEVDLSTEDGQGEAGDLISNMEDFKDTIKKAIEAETIAAKASVKALLGDTVDTSELLTQMDQWAQEDQETVDSLGAAVKDLLQKSIDKGAMDVDTATAIQIMQTKMLQISNGVRDAQLKGQMDMLRLLGRDAALDAESWASTVIQAHANIEEVTAAENDTFAQTLGYFEKALANDHIDQSQMTAIENLVSAAIQNREASNYLSLWDNMYTGMLKEAYSEEIESGTDTLSGKMTGFAEQVQRQFENASLGPQYMQNAVEALRMGFAELDSGLDSATKGALQNRYETLLPDIEGMGKLIDQANEAGQAVPEDLMTAYQEGIQLGALAGDKNAMAAYVAQTLAESYGDMDTFMAELEKSGIPMAELADKFGENFETELDRAFADTVEGKNFTGLAEALANAVKDNGEVSLEALQDIFSEYEMTLNLDEIPVKAEGSLDFEAMAKALQLDKFVDKIAETYEVKSGDTLWGIVRGLMEKGLETTVDQIAEENNISNPDVINVGDELTVPGGTTKTERTTGTASLGAEIDAETRRVRQEAITSGPATPIAGFGAEFLGPPKLETVETQVEVEPKLTTTGSAIDFNQLIDSAQVQLLSFGDRIKEAIAEQNLAQQADEQINQDMADEEILVDMKAKPEVEMEPAETGSFLSGVSDFFSGFNLFDALNTPIVGKTEVKPEVSVDQGAVLEQANEQIQSTLDALQSAGQPKEVKIPDLKIEEFDAGKAVEEMTSGLAEAFGTPLEADGTADITLEQENNADEARAATGSDVQSAYAKDFSTSAGVDVTLTANYTLANPSTTITFGGGATGSALVTASVGHAAGGFFTDPHMAWIAEGGFPEFVIPMDGSDNAFDLWEQAGEMLGAFGSEGASSISPTGSWTTPSKGDKSSRDINLNINGSGSIQLQGSGVSKEQVVEVLIENLRPALLSMLEEEEFVEGDGTYGW